MIAFCAGGMPTCGFGTTRKPFYGLEMFPDLISWLNDALSAPAEHRPERFHAAAWVVCSAISGDQLLPRISETGIDTPGSNCAVSVRPGAGARDGCHVSIVLRATGSVGWPGGNRRNASVSRGGSERHPTS